MDRYLCIHCHFYQPPRENPWLEAVELQDSAAPYHDWNERITAECYAPNSAARILDGKGRIRRIINNYANISFNFGPTLLSWLEEKAPDTYEAILRADDDSKKRLSGHGNALAQAYNHMILPLSSRHDKYTQALWGIRDFEHRFRRPPEGMWLPETAADTESLEVLADLGIKFTILAPHQGRQVEKLGTARRRNVEGGKIDPTQAYACLLPSGRTITLFFYDGPISRAVAFEGLLSNGDNFANRLVGGFNEHRKWPQLVHIATDGETYGHHHRHGEMAVAYALHQIESNGLARISNYGEYLEKYPATNEVEIIDNTSWSCAHGVERWRSNCGCNTGMKLGWEQEWRGPLRAALDSLRDNLSEVYDRLAGEVLDEPWAARDNYVDVVLDRSAENVARFFESFAKEPLSLQQKVQALKLLEMQRHAMLMYTSCGWFFDELSGIETVQVIMYAGRALQLAQELTGDHLEERFLAMLAQAHSNITDIGNGANVYNRWVKPAQVDLLKVAAHYAISSVFYEYAKESTIFCYEVKLHDHHRTDSGRARLAIGHAEVASRITLESQQISFGVLHFGDHNVSAGVRTFRNLENYAVLMSDAEAAFTAVDLPGTIRSLDRSFDGITYSLRSLFRDEQRRVLRHILRSAMLEAEASYRQLYEHHAPLMNFLSDINSPMPRVLGVTAEFVLNALLRRAFAEGDLHVERVATILETAKREKVPLDVDDLSFTLKRRLDSMAGELAVNPREQTLAQFNAAIALVRTLPFEVDLWKLQNVYYHLLRSVYPEMRLHEGDGSRAWSQEFEELGVQLGIEVESPTTEELPNAA
ncbi:MAG TPA: DUF3536 domain-containing protein [Clostridia bacterium]|nr:DUF3536 domain-containing protein [Clostridia bacterium]